jgi:hypothetical protein
MRLRPLQHGLEHPARLRPALRRSSPRRRMYSAMVAVTLGCRARRSNSDRRMAGDPIAGIGEGL